MRVFTQTLVVNIDRQQNRDKKERKDTEFVCIDKSNRIYEEDAYTRIQNYIMFIYRVDERTKKKKENGDRKKNKYMMLTIFPIRINIYLVVIVHGKKIVTVDII